MVKGVKEGGTEKSWLWNVILNIVIEPEAEEFQDGSQGTPVTTLLLCFCMWWQIIVSVSSRLIWRPTNAGEGVPLIGSI